MAFSNMATRQPYLFFDPHDNIVLAYILKFMQDRVLASYMKFHLELFSLTLSVLERSIQVIQVFNGLNLQITQGNHRVTIDDG